MLRISNFKLPLSSDEKKLPQLLAAAIGVPVTDVKILKKAIDARSRSRIWLIYTLEFATADEPQVLQRRLPFVEKSEATPPLKIPSSRHEQAAVGGRQRSGRNVCGIDFGACRRQTDCA